MQNANILVQSPLIKEGRLEGVLEANWESYSLAKMSKIAVLELQDEGAQTESIQFTGVE